MIEFINRKNQKLLKSILTQFPSVSPSILRGILAKKDIKVNDIRTKENIDICENDKITLYIDNKYLIPKIPTIFSDDNIIIVDKPPKIEVVSDDESKITLESILSESGQVYPVHRLDTNTSGLTIFAKSLEIKNEFISAFENGFIEKTYMALCYGSELKAGSFIDYIYNDGGGVVQVKNAPFKNAVVAKLDYQVVEKRGNYYALKINLHTGRTHQIRAQLANHKIYILGDGKYGDKNINRKFKLKYQALCAVSIGFKFPSISPLYYLNGKRIEIPFKYNLQKIFDENKK